MAIDSITKTYHDGIIFLEQFLGKQGFQAAWSVILGIVGNEHDIFCEGHVKAAFRGRESDRYEREGDRREPEKLRGRLGM